VRVRIFENHDELSVAAATVIRDLVLAKPRAVLGLATGGSPLRLYREMVRMHRADGLDFSGVTTFNLDEYIGLAADHRGSFHHFMREHLFDAINVPDAAIHVPSGKAADYREHCAWYEGRITAAGGIDLQILGLGTDGHIGFNEPGTSLGSRTNVQTLSPQTIQDNARFFGSPAEVPVHAVTMGVATILEARRILVLASGAGKAVSVARAIEGPVTASHTASALQLHPDTTWYLDRAAAAALEGLAYYEWIQKTEAEAPRGPAAALPR
jgi:glucosamine-6-phosphate deaminase